MCDSVIARNPRGFTGDLSYIRSHSGLFIGLFPYICGTLHRSYTSHYYVKEDGLFVHQ